MDNTITINIESKHIQNAFDKKNGKKAKRIIMGNWDQDIKKYSLNIDNHINIVDNLEKGIDFPAKKNILKELKKKLDSYKNQDIKKKRYIQDEFITMSQLISKLKFSELKCHYCLKKTKLIYEDVRDQNQWTLDRLNNNIAHTNENTVICDLKCNLQRRVKDEEKFLCDKQLKIIMLDK